MNPGALVVVALHLGVAALQSHYICLIATHIQSPDHLAMLLAPSL